MSLLKTKPSWAPNSIATQMGWQDPVSKEIYVSIPRLVTRLEEEARVFAIKNGTPKLDEIIESTPEVVNTEIEELKENEMTIDTKPEIEIEQPKKKAGRPKKIVSEVVEQSKSVQVIGEVVEYPDLQVIGE